jgi:quercetin dioxygenase-like cupin family protein
MTEHEETCVDRALGLPELADTLLTEARASHSQRAANTILTGASMRATVIALTEGAEMGEHEAPPAAILQVLSGQVELVAGTDRWSVVAGQVIAIPPRRHSLLAGTDSVVLLTVALH